ncbi:hypothetical protein [Georgenia faecalis]|uniref:hypothetical protein n=1 Tax=Georgenia faecalis TaxID=2483799 RepID=UPI000FDBE1B7|nr:hypothetical protein [Georgenia faecalis]
MALVTVTLFATVVTTVFRYNVAVSGSEYDALTSDTYRYLAYGAARWTAGAPPLELLASGDGTTAVIGISQLAFTAFGDTWLGVFLFGSLLGLVGGWLSTAALFVIRPRAPLFFAYALCVFPSVLYWSSSFGKESMTRLGLGLSLLGLAGLWRRQGGSVLISAASLATGLLIVAVIRPEIALLTLGAGAVATISVTRPSKRDDGVPRLRAQFLLVSTIIAPVVMLVSASIGGINGPPGLVEDLLLRHERTSIGEAQIGSSRPGGPLGLLLGVPTALFRPFPWEAGISGLASSLDTAVILAALAASWRFRRDWRLPKSTPGRMIVFAVVFGLGITAALAGYGNLGLLVRMRSLMIPSLLLIVALLPSLGAQRNEPDLGLAKLTGPRNSPTRSRYGFRAHS